MRDSVLTRHFKIYNVVMYLSSIVYNYFSMKINTVPSIRQKGIYLLSNDVNAAIDLTVERGKNAHCKRYTVYLYYKLLINVYDWDVIYNLRFAGTRRVPLFECTYLIHNWNVQGLHLYSDSHLNNLLWRIFFNSSK